MFDAEYMDGSATIISCGDDYLKMEVVKQKYERDNNPNTKTDKDL